MKANRITLIVALLLFTGGTTLYANSDSPDGRAYMGVVLDPTPLPALLVKHLGLSPDQGIRIRNVDRDSPADKAGLERDDIIIGFQGKDVNDFDTFVDEVRKAGVGTEVSLEIIHLGQHKTVTLTLEALEGKFDLKYPPEPDIVQSWRPGKIFRLRPGEENWMEILEDRMPPELDMHLKRFFNELHTYHHADGEDYTITIEGNPNDDDSKITVKAGDNEYETTVGNIDKLPEKYREAVEQDVKNVRKDVKERRSLRIGPDSWRMPDDLKSYLEKIRPRRDFQVPRFLPDESMLEKIQKQMKELKQRLDKLEKEQKQKPDSKEQPKKQKTDDSKKTITLEKGDQKKI